jgi:cytochrome c oxidase subunit 2
LIIFAATVVLWLLWNLITTFDRQSNTHQAMVTKHPNHSLELEWLLTGLPVGILMMIAFPSFRMLYLMDDTMDATFQQWRMMTTSSQ